MLRQNMNDNRLKNTVMHIHTMGQNKEGIPDFHTYLHLEAPLRFTANRE